VSKKKENRRKQAPSAKSNAGAPQPKKRLGGPAVRFLLTFLVLIGVCELVFVVGFQSTELFSNYLALNARISAFLLRALGTTVEASGKVLSGDATSLSVESGCDGIQPTSLFASAVLAFPGSLRSKLVGILIGAPVILGMNLIRIVTLFVAHSRFPDVFETMHKAVWPAIFIFLAALLWFAWVTWAVPVVKPQAAS
jgi:exosortase H (IPTLxxWG-CTERM-specific)